MTNISQIYGVNDNVFAPYHLDFQYFERRIRFQREKIRERIGDLRRARDAQRRCRYFDLIRDARDIADMECAALKELWRQYRQLQRDRSALKQSYFKVVGR